MSSVENKSYIDAKKILHVLISGVTPYEFMVEPQLSSFGDRTESLVHHKQGHVACSLSNME